MGEPLNFVTRADMLSAMDALAADVEAAFEDLRQQIGLSESHADEGESGSTAAAEWSLGDTFDLHGECWIVHDIGRFGLFARRAGDPDDDRYCLFDEIPEQTIDAALTVDEIVDVLAEKLDMGSAAEVERLVDAMRDLIRDAFGEAVQPVKLRFDCEAANDPELINSVWDAKEHVLKFGCSIIHIGENGLLTAVSPDDFYIASYAEAEAGGLSQRMRYVVRPRETSQQFAIKRPVIGG